MSVNPALATLSGLGAEAEEELVGFNWLELAHGEVGRRLYRKGSSGEPLSSRIFLLPHIGANRPIYSFPRGSVTRKGWQGRRAFMHHRR